MQVYLQALKEPTIRSCQVFVDSVDIEGRVTPMRREDQLVVVAECLQV
jgi:hypothetical protein